MPHVLRNKDIEIHMDLPNENYKFPRFDQTGKIVDVVFKGNSFSAIERTDNVDQDLYGQGFYNEFGLEIPVDFDEVTEGEWFHKIGVGLLKKQGSEYSHMVNYEVKPANFQVELDSDRIVIVCISENHNGYAYILKKEIELSASGFKIHYQLENTGEKEIQTAEYVHNFMSINKELIGQDYTLTLPFKLDPDSFKQAVNLEDKVKVYSSSFEFENPALEPFFYSHINGEKKVKATWQLINKKQKLGIKETGDFETSKVNLWGWTHVVSPELFYEIQLKPKETAVWNRSYELFEIP